MKTAAIYIGSIIGAGFASGREIIIFFYDKGFGGLILAAILLGLISIIFIYAQKLAVQNNLFKNIILLGMVLSYIMMVAASGALFLDILNAKWLVLISGVIIAFLSSFSIEHLKIINIIIIPSIIIMFIYLSLNIEFNFGEGVSPFNAFKYVGMNTLLGGVVIGENEKKYSFFEIIITAVIITVAFIVMFFCLYKIAYLYPNAELPVYYYAKTNHLTYISGVIIYLAIFTTQLSSGYMIFMEINKILKRYVGITFLILLSICSYNMPYKEAAEIIYPILGYMGCGYIIYNLYLIFKRIFKFNKFIDAFNGKIHQCGHKT